MQITVCGHVHFQSPVHIIDMLKENVVEKKFNACLFPSPVASVPICPLKKDHINLLQ